MKLRGYVVIGAIISIVLGFTLGKTVVADSPVPGSSLDPIVSKSYVDGALEKKVADLEKDVAELTIEAQALRDTINNLQTKINSVPTSSIKPNTPTPAKPDEVTVKPDTEEKDLPAPETVIGKTAYADTQSYLNMRSAPTTQADVIKKIENSEALVIQKVEGTWYHVKLEDGTVGWVAGWLLKVK